MSVIETIRDRLLRTRRLFERFEIRDGDPSNTTQPIPGDGESPTPETDAPEIVPASRASAQRRSRKGTKRTVSVALQGGGSYGAFAWGVLDRLLEDEEIGFDAISGSSAGAVNAVLVASGLAGGGRPEARANLERFWHRFSETAARNYLVKPGLVLDLSTRIVSPYQFNPLDINPLRDVIEEQVDFDLIRTGSPVKLLIGATRVSDGALQIFREKELTADVVLASACLPLLHQAVVIDGEPYWDGGYSANPPLIPLITASRTGELLVVQIIPTESDELPTTSPEIVKRVGQITFNSTLQRDLETLAAMRKLSEDERSQNSRMGRKLQRLNLHRISAEDHFEKLNEASPLNLDLAFLTGLKEAGRAAAEQWLVRAEAA